MGTHDGHRARLKERFSRHGLDSFNEINALELLLFYAIPRKDTNPIAHDLINHFETLDNIFSASERELMEVPGIGESAAALIRLVPAMYKKIQMSKTSEMTQINAFSDAAEYFIPRFLNEKDEVMMIMCLDVANRIVYTGELNRGIVNAVDINSRAVAETALKYKATSVILAHNHPSGRAVPSKEDDFLTKNVSRSLKSLGIKLLDHIVIAGNDYFSMAMKGFMIY